LKRLLILSMVVPIFASQPPATTGDAVAPASPAPNPRFKIQREEAHSWRAPFGLDRIGRPIVVVLTPLVRPEWGDYELCAYWNGQELNRQRVVPAEFPAPSRVTLEKLADELVLRFTPRAGDKPVELARLRITVVPLEAEAIARPDVITNPVDLGTVLVPGGWLLLEPGQTATLDVAAIDRVRDWPHARLTARYKSDPGSVRSVPMPLRSGARHALGMSLPLATSGHDRDQLVVVLDDGLGQALWEKTIPVMLVQKRPDRPLFGATYERLRYDAPISIREPATGKYTSLRYDEGWKRGLRDVVVWLPNGARFVFWRGSSYIPFWVGKHNTGACYEWAEIISQPAGAVDCVEPLMDKELRYGNVEIVESTPARVHVRWTYQSTDFLYKVWGDAAVEDYYFYPDGYGTRVVNLKSDPKNDYELSEFIILTPQATYPFEVLSDHPVDALFLDGRKHAFPFPNAPVRKLESQERVSDGSPAIYRLRLSKKETLAAIYFNPREPRLPPVVFAPFFDDGQMVTPCYWGSHWPLARGNSTGSKIDDRIQFTPCHNSVMSWAGCRPAPLQSSEVVTFDTLGRSKPMMVQRWAWLIGMTDADDARLVQWAGSFATPPSLELSGATLAFDGYAPERRAIRLVATSSDVRITIKPGVPCLNPVVEFINAPHSNAQVTLGDLPVAINNYAWDGRTLWLNATIERPAELCVKFHAPAAADR
jgi:hypothetical protein